MPKKNLSSRATSKSLSELRGYSLPQLHKGKKWFVDFFAFDPAIKTNRRKKYHIKDSLKESEKKREAARYIKLLTEKLSSGWNPWVDVASGRGFTEFDEVLDRYLEFISRASRDKTRHSYTSRVNIMREFISHMAIPIRYVYQFDTAFVAGFLDYIYLDRECGARTRNNYLGWCRSFAQWLIDRKYIDLNPCDTITKMSEDRKKRQPLSSDMLALMREHLSEIDKHFLLACMMEYYTFIRPTELSHLKIGDISIRNQTIFVSGTFSKNKQDNNVGLNQTILKLMFDLGTFSSPSDYYLFGRGFKPAAGRMGPDQFNKRWSKMRKALKWTDEYQFYSLKDSGIRDLANNVGIVVARDQARHSDVSTTNKYLCGRDSLVHEETKHFKGGL